MNFSVNFPINPVSFGQVSTLLMRGFFEQKKFPPLFVIGNFDISAQPQKEPFVENLKQCINKFTEHSRDNPTLKLWHLNGGLDSFSKKHYLLTFYELDQPTTGEINAAKNCDKLIFTNHYSKEIFSQFQVDSDVIPLAFDKYNFKKTNKKYFDDGRIVFNLCGKFEKRKHHKKIIQAWIKKFGNNKKYFLQCTLFNHFLNEEQNKGCFADALQGKPCFNVQFLGHMPTNEVYNDYLNSADIILGMSGGEGWGLPEFHSVGLGKHSVILNASGYKEWATPENSILINPNGKIEVYDGVFFKKGQPFNQGLIYDFNEDDFISGCEEAIKRHQKSRVNKEGLKIQEAFTVENTINQLLEIINK